MPPPPASPRFYKFSSRSSVDEDSDVAVRNLLDDEVLATADRCVVTEKANGKCAVVTMCQIQGKRFLFGGSKVGGAVSREGRQYQGAHRLVPLGPGARSFIREGDWIGGVAEQVLLSFLDQWDAMTPAQQEALAARLLGPSGSVVVPKGWTRGSASAADAAPDRLVTPPSTVAALAAGYRPALHPSAVP